MASTLETFHREISPLKSWNSRKSISNVVIAETSIWLRLHALLLRAISWRISDRRWSRLVATTGSERGMRLFYHALGASLKTAVFWQFMQKTLPPNLGLLNQQNLATLYGTVQPQPWHCSFELGADVLGESVVRGATCSVRPNLPCQLKTKGWCSLATARATPSKVSVETIFAISHPYRIQERNCIRIESCPCVRLFLQQTIILKN